MCVTCGVQQSCPVEKGDDYDRWIDHLQARLKVAKDTMVNVQWEVKEEKALRLQMLRRISSHAVGDQVLVWRPACVLRKRAW